MPQSLPKGSPQINAQLPANIERRIKRHVVAQVHNFFAATAPGLEGVCRDELLGTDQTLTPRVVPGGVEFSGRLDVCYGANLNLRTANRILMRIAQFNATGFGVLEKKVSDIPWEFFIPPGQGLDIHATSKQSRLLHTGAISERVLKAVSIRLGQRTTAPLAHGTSGQRLYIRVVKDRFTLSMDTSGESLYKRGIKTHGGRAPLRETAAAAILKLAGYRPGMFLLDAMCGSGSFSIEAAMVCRRIPAGWFRSFAFMDWPAFRPRQWAHMRKTALSEIVSAGAAPTILASDQNPVACRRLSETLEREALTGSVQVVTADFFHMPLCLSAAARPPEGGLIVLNPPYGKRLGSRTESRGLVAAIVNTLMADFGGWRFALLAPPRFLPPGLARTCRTRGFYHGGLRLALVTGTVE